MDSEELKEISLYAWDFYRNKKVLGCDLLKSQCVIIKKDLL